MLEWKHSRLPALLPNLSNHSLVYDNNLEWDISGINIIWSSLTYSVSWSHAMAKFVQTQNYKLKQRICLFALLLAYFLLLPIFPFSSVLPFLSFNLWGLVSRSHLCYANVSSSMKNVNDNNFEIMLMIPFNGFPLHPKGHIEGSSEVYSMKGGVGQGSKGRPMIFNKEFWLMLEETYVTCED